MKIIEQTYKWSKASGLMDGTISAEEYYIITGAVLPEAED